MPDLARGCLSGLRQRQRGVHNIAMTQSAAPRIVAENRDETDYCQRSTQGCCIDHTAELARDRTADSSCETW